MLSEAIPDNYVIELDFWTKLDIVAGMMLFFVIVISIVVCSISSICPLFRICPFNKKFLKDSSLSFILNSVFKSIPLFHNKFVLMTEGRHKLVCLQETFAKNLETNYGSVDSKTNEKKKILRPYIMDIQKEMDSSDYSECNFGEHMDLSMNKVDENNKVNESANAKKVGRLCFKLKYDKDLARLTIKILKADGLTLSDPNSLPVDNYIRIRLYRNQRSIFKFGRSKSSLSFPFDKLDLEIQTKIKHKTESPVFNEKFVIYVEEKHLRNYIMRLQMCDFDHYSCHTVKGEIGAKFREMNIFNGEEECFDYDFTDPIEDSLGEAYICLTYLPTAEKLYLKLTQLSGLPVLDKQTNCTDAYVRIALMSDGRALKKGKTSLRSATNANPVFNETYLFDVPNNQLEKIYFLISVLHHNTKEEKSGYLIGRIYIGSQFDYKSKYHWEQMARHSRKEIGTWYKIKG